METKTAEKKELFFDETAYNECVSQLERMKTTVDWLGAVWRDQPILSETKFTTEHLNGILLAGGAEYIEETIYEALKAEYEKLPGMTDHILNGQRPKVKVDWDQLERSIESLVSPGPLTNPNCRHDMIYIVKEKAAIRPEALKELRDIFSIYAEDPETTEIIERGRQAEAILNELQDWIRGDAAKRQKITGLDPEMMPATGKVEMFSRVRQPGQPWRSVFYQDRATGKWIFNARRLKGN